MLESALYIVPTPIGNLEDITLRAITTLKASSLIAAEDTRHTKILLDKLGIGVGNERKLISCHDHNEDERVELIANAVNEGQVVSLVSDAGTPLISDPGYKLVAKLVERAVKVIALPGPCAAITALCTAALPTDKFFFAGFLPVKDKELNERLLELEKSTTTTIFYESPRRILNTLKKLDELMPNRQIVVCRELTKTFESIYRNTAHSVYTYFKEHSDEQRGEFVLIVAGESEEQAKDSLSPNSKQALKELLAYTKVKVACKIIADLTGESKNALYEYALTLKQE